MPTKETIGQPDFDFPEAVQSNTEFLRDAYEIREDIKRLGYSLTMDVDAPWIYYSADAGKNQTFDVLNNGAGFSDRDLNQARLSDIYVWREMTSQIQFAFDFDEKYSSRTGLVYMRDLEVMTPESKIIGGITALHNLYQRGTRISSHTIDEAITRTGEVIGFTDEELADMIRIIGRPDDSNPHAWMNNSCEPILLEAVRNPNGVTRRAFNDPDGNIDLRYFGPNDILKGIAEKAYKAAISYDPHLEREQPGRRQDYARLKSNFPDQIKELEDDPDFLEKACELMRERALRFSACRLMPQYQEELMPDSSVAEVIPQDIVIKIAESVSEEIADYSQNIRAPKVASLAEAALKGVGPGYVQKVEAHVNKGIARLQEATDALKAA